MAESVWRRRAPVWLRIVTGILLFPALWFMLALSLWALLEYLEAAKGVPGWPFLVVGAVAGFVTWVMARKSPTPIAVGLAALALLALNWILSIIWKVAQALPEG